MHWVVYMFQFYWQISILYILYLQNAAGSSGGNFAYNIGKFSVDWQVEDCCSFSNLNKRDLSSLGEALLVAVNDLAKFGPHKCQQTWASVI